jgi:hypothetical protein
MDCTVLTRVCAGSKSTVNAALSGSCFGQAVNNAVHDQLTYR